MNLLSALVLVLGLAGTSWATTITVINGDGPGEGFNDPTPVAPIGGNPGTTLGAQRLGAFQVAAGLWGANLESSVPITIEASLDPLPCNANSAVLGAAGPQTVHANFPGTPASNTWYPQALANSLAATDLAPQAADVAATFNSAIGTTCAFPRTFYYGLDAAVGPNQTDFVSVVAHEIGHGLGFTSFVDLATGTKLQGLDDAYSRHLEDHDSGILYPAMSDAQRVAASTNTRDLHWVGPDVVSEAGAHVEMYAPNPQEPGSSVSHFSTSRTPNELMEPVYTGANHDLGLALPLLRDVGWPVDDGPPCTVADTPCADDHDACTDDVCQSNLECGHVLEEGSSGVACELSRIAAAALCTPEILDAKVARSLRRRASKAHTLLAQADAALEDPQREKKLAKIDRQFAAMLGKLGGGRAIRHTTSHCLTTIRDLTTRLRGIVASLPRTVD